MAIANLVRVTSATKGTGTLTLGTAVTGFITPSAAGMTSGQTYAYAIEANYTTVGDDLVATARETGTGVYTSAGPTLTRNVINSTNSNALLNLTGDEQVIITAVASSAGRLIAAGLETPSGNMSLSIAGVEKARIDSVTGVLFSLGYGLGYGPNAIGVGGVANQITSRTTGVTINKSCGVINMFTAAGSTTAASFTVTNSYVLDTDVVVLTQFGGTNLYEFLCTSVTNGAFVITFRTTGGTVSDQPTINFAIIKSQND